MTTSTSARNFQLPFTIRFERRLSVPGWLPLTVSVGAIGVALLLGAGVLALVGGNPWAAYAHIGRAAFGDLGVFSDTLVKATPLIFTGLACSVAFRMKLWNIGAEGQFYAGALAASFVVLASETPANAPGWIALPSKLMAAIVPPDAPGWVAVVVSTSYRARIRLERARERSASDCSTVR